MKLAVLATCLISSSFAVAATQATLRLPVMLDIDGSNDHPVHASVLNPKIVKAGGKALPDYLDISSTDQKPYQKVEALNKIIQVTLKKIKIEEASLISGMVPGDHDSKQFQTCFQGDGNLIADMTSQLGDMVYSDQYTIQGWKYKNRTESDYDSELSEQSKVWKNWNKANDAVLIVSSVGDDGTDINESIIKRCK